ncbi:hypothetical protein [Sphaerospermopsis sp. LEGE 08334]|uniref:hypothetical protein n=1 Tax=Sphaerospermopsis sp. LEGE 08334 TaxID=1828651 RepID=UPI00187E5A73|nr:hypothetical protein [Sphaerospermopsis sp. LEGE 08334]MBE9056351.1 hypothetical protein [Sphaerospermopsis sp. LEGE 08334]
MAKKCWVLYGQGFNGYWYELLICADSVTYQFSPTNPYTGNQPWMQPYVNGVLLGPGSGYVVGTEHAEIVTYPIKDQYCPNPRAVRDGSCDACYPEPPQAKYDCINGACIPDTTYSTPGLYSTLSECETACGTGCSGKCISNQDWATIEGLAAQLKNKNCS